jgi:hypothetical protein
MAAGKHLSKGDSVVAADGDELGKVAEVEDSCFKVHARKGKDYWLPKDAVAGRGAKTVLLQFDRDHLQEARMLSETHVGAHAHSDAEGSGSLLRSAFRLLMLVSLGAMVFKNRGKVMSASKKAKAKISSKLEPGEKLQTPELHES